jgi:hypothetical protein
MARASIGGDLVLTAARQGPAGYREVVELV